MKKLKLSELYLGKAEMLSREQLKKVLGGNGSGSGSSGGQKRYKCCWDNYPDDCSVCSFGTYCTTGSSLKDC